MTIAIIRIQFIWFDKVYCSPQGRAQTTAAYILDAANQAETSVTMIDELKDISWGQAEGYTRQQFMDQYGNTEFPDAFGSLDDAMTQIVDQNRFSNNILVVSHSAMIYWLQKTFPGLANDTLDNTSVTVVQYQHGEWKLVEINQDLSNK